MQSKQVLFLKNQKVRIILRLKTLFLSLVNKEGPLSVLDFYLFIYNIW